MFAKVRGLLTGEPRLEEVEPTARLNNDIWSERPWGLEVVEEGVKPSIDIVAIHGLNGHRSKTWTASNGKCWLKDFLKEDIDYARIILYGYDARTYSTGDVLSHQSLYGHSQTFLKDLVDLRDSTDTTQRPIIFVAHSLGGIVLKDALIRSNNTSEAHLERHKDIKLSTAAILFLGTPHLGSSRATLACYLSNIASIYCRVNDRVVQHLSQNAEYLLKQMDLYNGISHDFETTYGYEAYPTKIVKGTHIMIVDGSSAHPPGVTNAESIEIRKDHISMVKFESKQDDDYRRIARCLQIMAKGAPDRVRKNWCDFKLGRGPGVKTYQIQKQKQRLSEIDFLIPVEGLPRRHPAFFGRYSILKTLEEILNIDSKTIVVLCGQGGVGKTEIALQHAWAGSSHYSAIFWVDASSLESIREAFVSVANQIIRHYASSLCEEITPYRTIAEFLDMSGIINDHGEVSKDNWSSITVLKAVKKWLNREGNRDWLLVFDNFDNREKFKLEDFLPEAGSGSIIITSQLRDTAALGRGIDVDCLGPEEACDLLRQSPARTSKQEWSHNPRDDLELVESLGRLPLAITLAGYYMFREELSSGAYRHKLLTNMRRTLQWKSEFSRYPRSTYAAWELSFKAIEREDPIAAKILLQGSLYSNVDIPKRILIGKALEDDVIVEAFSLLYSYSLVNRTEQEGVTIHPIPHGCARESLDLSAKKAFTRSGLDNLAICLNLNGENEFLRSADEWAFERRLHIHVESISALMLDFWPVGNDDDAGITAESLLCFALFYQAHGIYGRAELFYRKAMRTSETVYGAEHEKTLRVALAMGKLYTLQHNNNLARITYERCLRHENLFSVVERCTARRGLAVVWYNFRKYPEAEELYRQALETLEAVLPEGHPDIVTVMNNLANTYSKQRKFDEAENIWQEIRLKHSRYLSDDHACILRWKQNMGLSYLRQDRNSEAQGLLESVWESRKALLGLDHPSTLRTQQNLSQAHFQQGRFQEAIKGYIEVNTARERLLGPNHLNTIQGIQMLADVQAMLGNNNKATELLEEVLIRLRAEDDPVRLVYLEDVNNALEILRRRKGSMEVTPSIGFQEVSSQSDNYILMGSIFSQFNR